MYKVFNRKKINAFLNTLTENCIYGITETDVVNKEVLPKLKTKLEDISSIETLSKFLTPEEEGEMMKRFFPLKYEEIKGNYYTKKIMYNKDDEKIYWIVMHGDNERIFKLKTDLYLERTVDERKRVYYTVRSLLEKLYGYWYYCEDENWYITDLNYIKGKKRILIKNGINYTDHRFGSCSKSDLIIM